MDALYGIGVRPSEGEGSAGMMNAVQEHLSDCKKDKEWLKSQVEIQGNQISDFINRGQ